MHDMHDRKLESRQTLDFRYTCRKCFHLVFTDFAGSRLDSTPVKCKRRSRDVANDTHYTIRYITHWWDRIPILPTWNNRAINTSHDLGRRGSKGLISPFITSSLQLHITRHPRTFYLMRPFAKKLKKNVLNSLCPLEVL